MLVFASVLLSNTTSAHSPFIVEKNLSTLALAVITLKRPIKILWNRAESIQGHCKRHAMTMRYKWGADLNGKITAAEMDIIADAGAYDYGSISVLKNYLFAAVGPYDVPNVRLNMKAVYTNNIPGGAFRGYGFPQITFASELQIAHIADRLGIDPVSVRLANCYREGSKLPSEGSVPQGVNLERLLVACADGIGFNHRSGKWTAPPTTATGPNKKRGIGIAAGMKSCGFSLGFPEGSEAAVVLEGGIVQAVGWSLFENFITEQGVILTDNLSTYLIPTVLDIPEKIVTIIDEMPDPMGPYGIRGLGEIPFIPTAPAIICAIYDATGIWFDRIPVTSERFLRAYQNIEP
jgi:CO/xanthine dehydrogenase Mo-binding subunit